VNDRCGWEKEGSFPMRELSNHTARALHLDFSASGSTKDVQPRRVQFAYADWTLSFFAKLI
jgi:hypothetical protein